MSSILGWIGLRGQRDIIAQATEHMARVVEATGLLRDAVSHMANGDLEAARAVHERLAAAEHEADILRRDIMAKLSQGLLLPPDRHDLVELISCMDDVADYALGASRILILLDGIPEQLSSQLQEFSEILIQAVGHLREALHYLSDHQTTRALDACTDVESVEEEADRRKAMFLQVLFTSDLSAAQLLLLRDLIEAMENTADRAEDSADLVRLIAVSQGK